MERTFIAVKPDGVKRSLVGNIISRFEMKGYKLIALKMIIPTAEIAAQHYEEHFGKPFYNRLVKYITSGPIVAMVWEGIDVVTGSRKLVGATNPDSAEVATIRFDFAQSMEFNVIHASDSQASATREISIYFKTEELYGNWSTQLESLMNEQKQSL